jgi:outer membrane cobalamin receptor
LTLLCAVVTGTIILAQTPTANAAAASSTQDREKLAQLTSSSVVPAKLERVTLNIPAQPMSGALTDLGAQTGLTIIVETKVSKGVKAEALHGSYTADEALKKLLDPAGLCADYLDSKTVAIRIAKGENLTKVIASSGALRLASATDQSTLVQADTTSTGLAGNSKSVENAESNPSATPDKESKDSLEEVVVTGTHIRLQTELTSPQIQITREDISREGYVTTDQLFADLPQNFNEISADGFVAGAGGNVSSVANQNFDRAAGIDLRGLGADSTLVLLNGTRRAGSASGRVVDISAIPLSVIERVDVVTDGRSAIYGSDAVGGVVNIITRRDFAGAETQVLFGDAHYGGERIQVSQIVGFKSEDKGIVLAYDFTRDHPVDLVRADLVARPTPQGSTQYSLESIGDNWRNSAYLSGHYAIADEVELFADGLYTRQRSELTSAAQFPGAATEMTTSSPITGDQYSASLGVRFKLAHSWQATLQGVLSVVDNRLGVIDNYDDGISPFQINASDTRKTDMSTVSLVGDGPVIEFGSITPRLATGVEHRFEKLATTDYDIFTFGGVPNDFSLPAYSNSRHVDSAFGELLVPIVEHGGRTALKTLQVSLAGRYDHYSDFGGKFTWQSGLLWAPLESLAVRGSFATSYRAPALIELAPSSSAGLYSVPDPKTGGTTPVLFLEGNNPALKPETAETWTVGVDLMPNSLPHTKVSVNYFDITYRDRIDVPSISTNRPLVLDRGDEFGSLLNRAPTPAQLSQAIVAAGGAVDNESGLAWTPDLALPDQGLLGAFPNLVLFDSRLANVAVERVRGFDFLGKIFAETSAGRFDFGLNVSYVPEHTRSLTPMSPAVSHLNQPGYPVDTRGRATAGWTRRAFGVVVAANYFRGYPNPFSTPDHISSFTTIDLALHLDGGNTGSAHLQGWSAAFNVQNLMDRRPPLFLNEFSGVLYEPTNVNSIGRYMSLRVTKTW